MNDSESNIILSSVLKTQRKSIINSSRVFFLLMLASLFLLFSCEREDMFSVSLDAMTYLIGDTGPGGGIVFYITDGGFHGMEVAPSGWYGGSDPTSEWTYTTWQGLFTSGTYTAIGMGSANTAAIILQNSGAASAALLCKNYSGGVKNDWFLPSQDELQQIWWNLVSDQSSANSNRGQPYTGSLGNFVNSPSYWTSTEASNTNAQCQEFTTGLPSSASKGTGTLLVRPVRKF